MIDRIRIGTRGSRLALWQANHVKGRLEAAHDGLAVEIVTIHTSGDRDQATSLTQTGGIGFFTKEIEQALIEGRVDLAVHSLKDLPTVLVPGLALGAVPAREDTRDVLIGRPGRVASIADLTPGTRVATSSPRRQGQLLAACPGILLIGPNVFSSNLGLAWWRKPDWPAEQVAFTPCMTPRKGDWPMGCMS